MCPCNKLISFFLLAASITCSAVEVPKETKEAYADLLVQLHLVICKLDNTAFRGSKAFRNTTHAFIRSVKDLEGLLKSDTVIDLMSGDIDKVEGENAGWRMLRTFRRQTRNPFAAKIGRSRLITPPGVPIPKGGSGFEDEWTALMDQGKIKFKVEKYKELWDLEKFVEARAVDYVNQLVFKIYTDQGGVLKNGSIDFSRWSVESRANIFEINIMNYRGAFCNLDSIKFTKVR